MNLEDAPSLLSDQNAQTNPALQELYRPSIEADVEEVQREREWRREQRTTIYKQALDFENFAPEWDEDVRQSALVTSFLQTQMDAEFEDRETRAVYRERAARYLFGGLAGDSDAAFLEQVRAAAETEKGDRELMTGLNDARMLDFLRSMAAMKTMSEVITRRAERREKHFTKSTTVLDDSPELAGFESWYEGVKDAPGAGRYLEHELRDRWNTAREQIEERVAPFRDDLRQAFLAFQTDGEVGARFKNLYYAVDGEERRVRDA